MSRIVLNRVAVARTARTKGFQVCRSLARDVAVGAKALAPRGSRLHGSGTTDSRPSIISSFGQRNYESPKYVIFEVFNTADHAATVAAGSRPHMIQAKAGKVLAFQSERFAFARKRAGRSARALFFARKVRHPGNKRPVRYLQTPLAMYGRKHGFKVTTVANNRSRLP